MVIQCANSIQQECSRKVSNPVINPYHILQVRIDATLSEIRQNYRRLSLLHHPGRRAPNDAEIQRRTGVFELLAACYETLVYHRNHYDALLTQHSSAVEHHHHHRLPIVRKGEIHVGGKRMMVFGSLQQNDNEYVPVPLVVSSSSSDEEEQQQHYTWQDTNRMFAGPLALLYRAKHYEPFTNPYKVFESVFGHAVFPQPQLHHVVQWLPTEDYSTNSSVPAAASWTGSTTRTCDGTIVSLTSRTVRNCKITRTKTTTIDKSGRRNVHIQVTSEQLPTSGDSHDWIPNHDDSAFCRWCCYCPWCAVESSSNNALAESRDPEFSCTFEQGEEEERCPWPEMTNVVNMCGKLVPG